MRYNLIAGLMHWLHLLPFLHKKTNKHSKPENPTAAHIPSDVVSITPAEFLFIDIYKGGLSSRVSYLAFDRSEISSVPRRGATDDDDDVTGSLRGDGSSCVQAPTAGMILPNTAHSIYTPFPLHVQACREEQACLFASQLRLPKKKRYVRNCKAQQQSRKGSTVHFRLVRIIPLPHSLCSAFSILGYIRSFFQSA